MDKGEKANAEKATVEVLYFIALSTRRAILADD